MIGMARRTRWLVLIVACGTLLGCAAGRDRPSFFGRLFARGPAPESRVSTQDEPGTGNIPLVPIQPPPLYRNEKDKTLTPIPGPGKTVSPITPAVARQPLPPLEPNPQVPPLIGTTQPQPMPQPQPQPMPEPRPQPQPAEVSLEKVLEAARARYATMESYVARFTRREVIGSRKEPEEMILFKFRKQPFSVYFKWLGEVGNGREAVYVQGHHDSKIHTLLAAGDIPLMPAGKRMSLSPDNILVTSAARHSIVDAGIGTTLDRLMQVHAASARGDASRGQLTDRGIQNRPDYEAGPLRVIEHTMPAGL